MSTVQQTDHDAYIWLLTRQCRGRRYPCIYRWSEHRYCPISNGFMHSPAECSAIREEKARYLSDVVSLQEKGPLRHRTVGPFNQRNSMAKKTRRPTAPMTSGTRTCADDHGNCIPPQVIARRMDIVLPAITMMPL